MPSDTTLQLQTQVFTAPAREFGRHGQTFSPTTATLVTGEADAVLVDAQYIRADIDELGDLIERSGRRLTAIYVTHPHADHYLGIGELVGRFPGARALATAPVLAALEATLDDQMKQWHAMFGDQTAEPTVLPVALAGDVIELEGNELRVIEVGQGDIAPSTVVHVPAIDAVIAGDVVYNGIHPMLALSGPEQWQQWIASVGKVASLAPKTVVAGHKRPDASDEDLATIIDGTRAYIGDFRDAVAASANAEDVVAAMRSKYPGYENLTTLVFSASAHLPRRG